MPGEITKLQPCEDWFYQVDGGFTFIYDEEQRRVECYYRTLPESEVKTYIQGYKLGVAKGIQEGRAMKSSELRKALGL